MASGRGGGRFLCASVGSNFVGFIADRLAVWSSRDHTLVSTVGYELTDMAWRTTLRCLFLTGIMLLFGIVMGFFINANTVFPPRHLSQPVDPRIPGRVVRADTRKPNLFTGFDPQDDFKLHELKPERPLHVINGALNLVKGEELAWQERKAESFTMSRCIAVRGELVTGPRPNTLRWQRHYTRYGARYFRRGRESQYGIPFLARGRFPDDPV